MPSIKKKKKQLPWQLPWVLWLLSCIPEQDFYNVHTRERRIQLSTLRHRLSPDENISWNIPSLKGFVPDTRLMFQNHPPSSDSLTGGFQKLFLIFINFFIRGTCHVLYYILLPRKKQMQHCFFLHFGYNSRVSVKPDLTQCHIHII